MSDLASVVARLEASLTTQIGSTFNINEPPDVVATMLAGLRSPNTRRAYQKDINDFFQVIVNRQPTRDLVLEFLHLEQTQAVRVVLDYKSKLIEKKLKPATVNRRLAAIRSLTAIGRKIGVCNYTLEDVKAEKYQAYRDTTGIDKDAIVRVLNLAKEARVANTHRSRLKGIRDYALLRLLWGNALRRGEIAATDISDFNNETSTLLIMSKGSNNGKNSITLPPKTAMAISQWLRARGEENKAAPLFVAVDNANYGKRLSGNAIYTMVDHLCAAAGIS